MDDDRHGEAYFGIFARHAKDASDPLTCDHARGSWARCRRTARRGVHQVRPRRWLPAAELVDQRRPRLGTQDLPSIRFCPGRGGAAPQLWSRPGRPELGARPARTRDLDRHSLTRLDNSRASIAWRRSSSVTRWCAPKPSPEGLFRAVASSAPPGDSFYVGDAAVVRCADAAGAVGSHARGQTHQAASPRSWSRQLRITLFEICRRPGSPRDLSHRHRVVNWMSRSVS